MSVWQDIRTFSAEGVSVMNGYVPESVLPTNSVTYSTDAGGQVYCHIGNTHIKVTEHFPETGRSIGELIEDMILYAARQDG